MTPRERYLRDPEFNALVTMLESYIVKCQFTPTELREAALLAAIHYEEKRPAMWLNAALAGKESGR